jgi:4a-hydroxytetrahydrobiopterin dehydratase
MQKSRYPMDDVDEREIQSALINRLRGWSQAGKALERTFEFADFRSAIAFVDEVADKAEDFQHHPDIDIRYNKVRFTLTSHDAGGLTRRDLILAGYINEIASKFQKRRIA